jgi:hypothetical protein
MNIKEIIFIKNNHYKDLIFFYWILIDFIYNQLALHFSFQIFIMLLL